jgi:hypothetical protein
VYFPAVAPPLAKAGCDGANNNPGKAIAPAIPTTEEAVFWNNSLLDGCCCACACACACATTSLILFDCVIFRCGLLLKASQTGVVPPDARNTNSPSCDTIFMVIIFVCLLATTTSLLTVFVDKSEYINKVVLPCPSIRRHVVMRAVECGAVLVKQIFQAVSSAFKMLLFL